MFFRDVIGQEEIKQRLIQEVNEGRIPHAQLICGPEGVGKMPLATHTHATSVAPIGARKMLAVSVRLV